MCGVPDTVRCFLVWYLSEEIPTFFSAHHKQLPAFIQGLHEQKFSSPSRASCYYSFTVRVIYIKYIKPLAIRMLKQVACKDKLNNALCKFFNKHQNDFQYVARTGARTTQELLAFILNKYKKFLFRPINNIDCYVCMYVSRQLRWVLLFVREYS